MSQMEYVRRPELAGVNVKHLTHAYVRGSVRRKDPDGVAPYPYFPGVQGGSLFVSIDGGATITINFTTNSHIAIVTAVTTALDGVGKAIDVDGCLGIQTLQPGYNGSVEVLGGTAASALGFNVGVRRIYCRGGDIETGPENRTGNPFGVAFPNKGENLNTQSFVRALSKLATNADVLYADHAKFMARMEKLGPVPALTQTLTGTKSAIITAPFSAKPLYTGFGVLTASSAPDDLSAYYILVDANTERPLTSKVTGVVRGTVTGDGPFVDAGGLVDSGNVLGVSFVRSGPINIDNIPDGRTIYSSSAAFASVKVGDLARISGDDETISNQPWDNRGLRWVVEAVSPDGTEIALRPMSKAEFEQFNPGSTLDDSQPIVGLNFQRGYDKNFGTVLFYTGSFLDSGIKFVISPPLPAGTTAEVWAAVRTSLREELSGEILKSASPFARALQSYMSPFPTCLISRPTFTLVGGNLQVGAFDARVEGRFVKMGTSSVTAASVLDGVSVIYWDYTTNQVAIGTPTATSLRLGLATKGGGVFTDIRAFGKTEPSYWSNVATVGTNGQFADLMSAVAYANKFSEAYEFILLSDQTLTGQLQLHNDTRIVGAHQGVQILLGSGFPLGSKPFQFNSCSGEIACLRVPDADDLAELLSPTPATDGFFVNISRCESSDASKVNFFTQMGGKLNIRHVLNKATNGYYIDADSPIYLGTEDAGDVYISRNYSVTYIQGALQTHEGASVGASLSVTNNIAGGGWLTIFGTAAVGGLATLSGGVLVPRPFDVTVGNASTGPGVKMYTDASMGRIAFAKVGESSVDLTKDQVQILRGGPSSDAQSMHKHQDLIDSITAEANTRSSADTAEANARSSADTAEANTRSSADTALSTAISTEATTRSTNDTTLSTRIDNLQPDAAPQSVAAASATGSSARLSKQDHVHAHGNQAGGALHAVVVAGGADGFMTGADKTKLDGMANYTPGMTPGQAYYINPLDLNVSNFGDLGFIWTNIWTGPIVAPSSSMVRGIATPPTTIRLIVYAALFGFTHTNNDGDIWTRLCINNVSSGSPGTEASRIRAGTLFGNYAGALSLSDVSTEQYHNVPDDANHWACHMQYTVDVPCPNPAGYYINLALRGNGGSDLSPNHMADGGIFTAIPPWDCYSGRGNLLWIFAQ